MFGEHALDRVDVCVQFLQKFLNSLALRSGTELELLQLWERRQVRQLVVGLLGQSQRDVEAVVHFGDVASAVDAQLELDVGNDAIYMS